jgi:hypothetical protein
MNIPLLTADVAVYRTSLRYRYNTELAQNDGVILSQSLPNGTYQQSCFNCSLDGFVEGAKPVMPML